MLQVEEELSARRTAEEELRRHREHLEELVAARTAELAERNAALLESEAHARAAEREASVANQAKSEFLAAMSHELRTPLEGIMGFAEILAGGLAGELTGQQRQYAQNIVTSGQHLLRLINDILDLAKVEAGKMELEQSPVVIDELLSFSFALFRERALAKHLTLSQTLSPDLRGQRFWADERKVRQILWNLLSNAIKFTPDGGSIEMRASKVRDQFVFAVADTGVGINRENQGRIFDAFEQVRTEGQRGPAGTGLGLALSRQFAELHGGSIWVESPGEGFGSTFYFSIPATMEQPAGARPRA
jgi:signal transduction histidine kinase